MARENLCAKPNRMGDATSKVPGWEPRRPPDNPNQTPAWPWDIPPEQLHCAPHNSHCWDLI